MDYTKHLSTGLNRLEVDYNECQINKIIEYLRILKRWSKTYNLTSIRDVSIMIDKHILDSASTISHIAKQTSLLDVGTGAGLPGLVLAILREDLCVTLLDSNNKKTCFIRQVINDLGIKNAQAKNARVESIPNEKTYDYVISRAFTSLGNLYNLTHRLCNKKIIAMKAELMQEELIELPSGSFTVIKKDLGLNCKKRNIVLITPQAES